MIVDSECAKGYSKSSGNPFSPEAGETEVEMEAWRSIFVWTISIT